MIDGLLTLVAWTTPIMAVLAFPLSHDIVDAFAALASQHGGMAEPNKWLRVIFSRFAILFMPFVFGTLGATVLTVNSIPNNWVTNYVLLYAYMIAGGLLFAVFFAIYDAATSLMSGDKRRVRLVSFWFGWAWAVLYVSLGLQLYAFLVPALR
jgi:hypothetical protein